MFNSVFLFLHITAGSLGILSGMVAMFTRKGVKSHKKIGSVFFISMIVMSSTAVYLALFQPYRVNVLAGLLTFYMVVTGWRTAQNTTGKNGSFEYAGLVFILGVVTAGVIFGMEVLNKIAISGEKMPLIDFFIFFFTGVGVLCMALDVRVLIKGGVYGAQRIARHLWRTCFALYVATSSLFLGQPQVFPEALRGTLVLAAPVILVVLSLFFWVVRVYFVSRFKLVPVRNAQGKGI
ncbi:MAG: hypothetical protein ABJG78_02180 [Cyclobacteriaceae bacterium]